MTKTFLWIKDRKEKSRYTFWKTLMGQLAPNVIVESKTNNSELVKAVINLKDEHNKYIIIFDNSFDNLQVAMEQKRLKECADKKDNVYLIDIICFEYIILEFADLLNWVYAPDDIFFIKRENAIFARKKLIESIDSGNMNYSGIKEIIQYDGKVAEHNVEQLAAKILYDLTRNTGFEISKGKMGECWTVSCCEWKSREDSDVCGLDFNRMTIFEKMQRIYERTCLKEQLGKVGLEVAF